MSSPATIPAALARHAGERRDAVAVRSKRHGLWHTLTFGQLAARVAAVAGGLRQLDVQAGAPVALVAENSPHWIVCDLAIQSIGARSVALSPQMPPDVAARLLAGSGATVIVCGDQEQVDLVLDAGALLDGVSALVLIDSTGTSQYDDPRLRSLHDLEEAGAGEPKPRASSGWAPGDCRRRSSRRAERIGSCSPTPKATSCASVSTEPHVVTMTRAFVAVRHLTPSSTWSRE